MFNLTDRTLMKMLFERGMVTEIDGTFKDGWDERRWEIRLFRADLWRDNSYYTVSLSGWSEDFVGESLDDVLDKLQAHLANEAKARERIRHRRATA